MNNMSSYCGLVDEKVRTSDKYLPVKRSKNPDLNNTLFGVNQLEILLFIKFFSEITSDQLRSDS